jgi:hypothetical protein
LRSPIEVHLHLHLHTPPSPPLPGCSGTSPCLPATTAQPSLTAWETCTCARWLRWGSACLLHYTTSHESVLLTAQRAASHAECQPSSQMSQARHWIVFPCGDSVVMSVPPHPSSPCVPPVPDAGTHGAATALGGWAWATGAAAVPPHVWRACSPSRCGRWQWAATTVRPSPRAATPCTCGAAPLGVRGRLSAFVYVCVFTPLATAASWLVGRVSTALTVCGFVAGQLGLKVEGEVWSELTTGGARVGPGCVWGGACDSSGVARLVCCASLCDGRCP